MPWAPTSQPARSSTVCRAVRNDGLRFLEQAADEGAGGDGQRLLLGAHDHRVAGAGHVAVPQLAGIGVLVAHEGGAVEDGVERAVAAKDLADLVGVPQVGPGVGDPGIGLRILQAVQADHLDATVRQVAGSRSSA